MSHLSDEQLVDQYAAAVRRNTGRSVPQAPHDNREEFWYAELFRRLTVGEDKVSIMAIDQITRYRAVIVHPYVEPHFTVGDYVQIRRDELLQALTQAAQPRTASPC